MVVRLNRAAFDFAKELIVREHFVFDERDARAPALRASGKSVPCGTQFEAIRKMVFGDQ